MLNWGIIGLGNMASKFAISINQLKNTKLLGIASKSELKLKNFGDQYNIEKKHRYNNYEEILSCKEIDAIYIATLNNTHVDIIIKAAEAKKNVLCEKPLSTNYEDAIKIFDKIKKSTIFFLEGIAYRSHEQTEFVVNKIINNEIGDLKSIESTFGFLLKKINPESRLFNKNLGGGAILDVGCYPASYSLLLADLNKNNNLDPKIIDVSGSICKTGVDEVAYATLLFKNNIVAKIGAAIRLKMNNQTLITGSKGSILVTTPWLPEKKSFIEIKSKTRYYKSFINSKLDIFANQIDIVNKCILEGKKETNFPGMKWNDSIKNMLIIDKWKKKLLKINNEKNN